MKLHIDGTSVLEDVYEGYDARTPWDVTAPYVVFDEDAQRNTDGPFDHLWQALAARALREYLARGDTQ